jgi:DNA adenine methylase
MISYIGGKNTISKWIRNYIPSDIETYVEPFGGMFWVLFNMDLDKYTNLKKIVYNDFNPLNVNLFRCVSEDHKRLLDECEKIPVQKKGIIPTPDICKEFFNSSQNEIYSNEFSIGDYPNYEAAAKYALVLTNVFSGANPEKGKFIDLKGKYHSKFTSFINKLKKPNWQKLFDSITVVENLDFQEVLEKYDSESTYFYVDPPYYIVGEGSYYSNHDFTREDHERLANSLKGIGGKFSLSYYHFDQLEGWFVRGDYRWEQKDFHKSAMAKAGKAQTKGTEILIMNYGITKPDLESTESEEETFEI